MPTRIPLSTPALPAAQAATLRRALTDREDVTVFVDGTAMRLPAEARDAVVDLLRRLADGDAVTVTSAAETLTTSQAAAAAGISHTYLRNLTDAGVIPVEYRGTHRRIRSQDVAAWLATQKGDSKIDSADKDRD
ncbi:MULTISPECIES: helix-turn-helix domain-containing protein [unclassified Arthrobacter]|uniref:helix-turn-helix domain-containing protein n=1 Tax=unclassified Arthrobacter TaxID=235627 RepID=UPI0014922B1B|nr:MULTISPECIES: helix-turn-helix domain-containing protein [unclassified Arthrobacter]MBE0010421.1 DNA-binding protein [Arthrobacter sp. AET 35A]NOJ59156.1 helix-turn-helix domain-containing protein [Arthrobacter sp. 260]NOJ64256.1 helix-turn-helix domain-containing protein [Arthrobacter sp. 147(2020)]